MAELQVTPDAGEQGERTGVSSEGEGEVRPFQASVDEGIQHSAMSALSEDAMNLELEQEEDHELDFGVLERGKNFRYERCKKNPGHTNMSLVKDVTLEDLPVDWRYPDLFGLIMQMSRLVVRITVPYVSPNRPRKYPGYKFRGKWMSSVGTGIFKLRPELHNKPHMKCPFKDCPVNEKPHQVTTIFEIRTSNHVVFDDLEVEHITVDFFYDSEKDEDEQNVVTCQGVQVLTSFKSSDTCTMFCVSHDLDLFKKVESLPPYPSIQSAFQAPVPQGKPEEPLVVIISHPHGHFKHVAFGTWVGFSDLGMSFMDVNLKEFLSRWEEKSPDWIETGLSVDGAYLHPEVMKETKRYIERDPGMMFSEWVKQLNIASPETLLYHYITYSTATCPGSSGAKVCIFLPGRHGTPWVHAGSSHHFRYFKDDLNASGSVNVKEQYLEEVAAVASGRERL